jgi:hypothetical protein
VRFVLGALALALLPVLQFSPVSVVPPLLYTPGVHPRGRGLQGTAGLQPPQTPKNGI